YIDSAASADAIGYRPIGYSIFLRVVHAISASDTFLVTLQYILVQGASLWLFLTLVKRCGLSVRTGVIVLMVLLLNPMIPYLCNYVSSDALFVGLSLIWITVLMALVREPDWRLLALQVGLLFVIFHLRYVALFYPAVASLTFLLMRKKGSTAFKLIGIISSVGVVIACMGWIKHITYKQTGANVFSAFSGWQIANNALHLYPWVPVDTAGLPSPECRELAADVRDYFEKAGPAILAKEPTSTTEYMWVHSSPLHRYMADVRRRERTTYFNAWNRVAPVFTQYGYFLIRRHPLAYLRYYGWPSARSFFVPGPDVFAVYNEGNKTVDPIAMRWFRYRSIKVRVWSATIQASLLAPIPWICLFLNIAFVVVCLWFLGSRRCREGFPVFTGALELTAAYLLANAVFCIFASPSVLRYQVLPMILLFLFTVSGLRILIEKNKENP
ncbi:MAG TPA: hypothetical protein VG605_14530, partial [Puia sp.]|nr:hypothetical protein [Puia sp.]